MKVIYTNTIPEKRDHNACYRTSFLGVIGEASFVHVDDDFPNADEIRNAYSHLNGSVEQNFNEDSLVPVEQFDAVVAKLAKAEEESEAEITRLKGELAEANQAVLTAEEQAATAKGEFASFLNDIEAMKARIAELESGVGGQTPEDGQKPSDTQPQPINYSGLKVDELRAVLTEKGIAFEPGAKKDELLALIPKE
ncbi:HeH/LEM domain protein [Acinetobacter baumannii Naval-72]|nr:HeH/LEM domain protein [Acinetobacter baumannii Naval-72]